ncbi:hypothetical protein L5515_017111 [Caenorhabditis briggsae]|uniref:Uncharacterized protein n=1 Tax=Caenorhabditis briggsae TaxID=6238 RepID=A0AAE9FG68_CAEBR|nr:hypothetical protein L5515_017111 [Caenorhabditis briggsae]
MFSSHARAQSLCPDEKNQYDLMKLAEENRNQNKPKIHIKKKIGKQDVSESTGKKRAKRFTKKKKTKFCIG